MMSCTCFRVGLIEVEIAAKGAEHDGMVRVVNVVLYEQAVLLSSLLDFAV